ncbi:MAG: DUF2878 domain-containing protein, partial [Arenimonas sp.]
MKSLVTFLAYQAVWFAAVIGAGAGLPWPGVLAGVLFVGAMLALSPRRDAGLRLVFAALVLGVLLDGGLATMEWLRHAAPAPALFGAPVWILSLWAAFALTLTGPMAFLQQRPVSAFVLGAVFGPLAYWGAARGWSAVTFAGSPERALIALALGWGVATLT